MTHEDVNRILRNMEHIRELSYEAESRAEKKRLLSEYGALWFAIEPYVNGREPYTE